MCKFNFIFRVRSQDLPNVSGQTNAERYQSWAKKWEKEKGTRPTMGDLQQELLAAVDAYNQTTEPRFVSGECA